MVDPHKVYYYNNAKAAECFATDDDKAQCKRDEAAKEAACILIFVLYTAMTLGVGILLGKYVL